MAQGNITTGHRRLNFWTWTVGIVVGIWLLITWISGGFAAAVITAAMIALFTGLYTLIFGRRSWLRLKGRKAGAMVMGGSFVVFMFTAALAPLPEPVETTTASDEQEQVNDQTAEPTPSATPTKEPKPTKTPTPEPEPKKTKEPKPEPDPKPKKQNEAGTRALALLEDIPIKGRAPKTGYDRDQFGNGWEDTDGNGCDTRNDILAAQMRAIVYTPGDNCTVEAGTLTDPYTNTVINFVQGFGTSNDVQIDHVVALSDAWQKGAQQLSYNQRVAFANDPTNLMAVDGPTNASKGDSDAATWLPPNRAYWCEYVARQISVKATYNLWVTQAEHDAMVRILSNCSNAKAPPPKTMPPAEPDPTPEPDPVAPPAPPPPAPEPPPVAPIAPYENCDAVVAAGAAPISAGDPGWGSHLDGDGDGVACGGD